MLTNTAINDLIKSPKEIIKREPAKGYNRENGNQHCNLTLKKIDKNERFSVFIRQNDQFIENFSIGLLYTIEEESRKITRIRCNGAHGEVSHHKDGHYNRPHIHRTTEKEIRSGGRQPQERHREITEKYNTFEEALRVSFSEMNITNWSEYFPELQQGDLFNGH